MHGAITDVPGVRVGHYTDLKAATGCTVVLCEQGAIGGVEVRGAAPETRNTDLLRPMHLVERAHAVLLAGGSAFGLDAAGGVVRYLEEKGIGFDAWGVATVPIVSAAILFDLDIGDPHVRPDAEAGYRACMVAGEGAVAEGNVGAGTGATIGKLAGPKYAMKGGLGTASQEIAQGIILGAVVAVGCVGDVVHPQSGKILAGARNPDNSGFLDSLEAIKQRPAHTTSPFANTTIGVVATNARLTKDEANQFAQLACNGYATVIRPTTVFDGDTLFALSAGDKKGNLSAVGAAGAEVVAQAIVRAIERAESLHGIPARVDI